MTNRIVAFLLTMCLIISMIPGPVFAVSGDEQIGNIVEGSGEDEVELVEESPEELSEEEVFAEEPVAESPVIGEGCTAYADGMHVHNADVTEPTCVEAGYTTYTCQCGDSYVADRVDAKGHNMVNGDCTRCDTVAPVVTVGNVEKTGKIKLTWDPVAGAAKYRVLRATEKNGEYERILTTTDTVCINYSIQAGETFYYKVVALDAKGKVVSEESEIVKRTCDLPRPVVSVTIDETVNKPMVTWESVEGAVKYQVYRATAIDGEYARIQTTTGNSCTNVKAVAGEKYYYKVRAIAQNSGANSAFSEIVSGSIRLAQPVVSVVTNEEVNKPEVTWQSVEGAVKYQVYRATAIDGEYARIQTTTGNSCINVKAVAGEKYYYKVRAIAKDSVANSEFSEIVSGICRLARPVVTVITNEEANKPEVTWQSVEGAVKYQVYRATAIDGEYARIQTTTGNSCINVKAVTGEKYYYKVRAIAQNSAANSEFSEVVSGACRLARPVVTVITNEEVNKPEVTWQSVEGAVKYQVYRATAIDGEYTRIQTTTGNSCINVKAVAGEKYYYKVRAIAQDSAANSEFSEIVSGVCRLTQPVVTVITNEKANKPEVTWQSVEGAVKYQVYRATAIDGEYTRIQTTTGNSCINVKAVAGESYYYKVRAIAQNSAANSEFSEVVSGICRLAQPVVEVTKVEKTGKLKVTWESVDGAKKYEVYRATEIDGNYAQIMTTSGTVCTNTSAEAGKTYYYKVKALAQNSLADSDFSEIVSGICVLAQPVITASNDALTGKVMVTWKAVAGAKEYKVYRATEKNGKYSLIETTGDTSITDKNTVTDQTYYYYVVAIADNTKANSTASAIEKRVADCAKPTVTGTADVNTGKPRLNWEAVEDAVSYKIYRATTPDGEYELMHTTKGTTYQNVTAEAGNTYYYKITAQGKMSSSASAMSDVVTVQAVGSEYKYVFSSYTTTKSGSAERNTNLYLSCKAINGTILAPGETFSFNEIVGPRTAEKGYQSAPIVGGMGRGGGICQVSTTLFNVALYANLDITQRKQHSVAVTYVPLGRDAMIYKTSSDLKFVNTSDYYVKVLASANGGTVSISLMTREKDVSPKDDVDLVVTYASGTYTLKRYYQGKVNYTTKSKY